MKSFRTFFISVFAMLALFQGCVVSAGTGSPKAASEPAEAEPGTEGVINLTSRNFDSSISDGSIWLIQFHSPWCG